MGSTLKRTSQLKRKTPIRKKGVKKKPVAKKCSWGRCASKVARVRISDQEAYCVKHARWIADKLVGDWVRKRDRQCVKCGKTYSGIDEKNPLQWAHIISRGARFIQYHVGADTDTPGNSVALCSGCHFMFTNKPAKWQVFVEDRWPGLWTRLIHLEMRGERDGKTVDLAAIIIEYRDKLGSIDTP